MSLLGIDIGTSSVKVIILDSKGAITANITEEYVTSNPFPMWSEQQPQDWWQATCRATCRSLKQAGIAASAVKGIGLSGQMVGLVVLDKNGEVLRPCIMWNDQRSVQETEELTAAIGLGTILKETSNPIFATFVAPKLVWMARHEPDLYERISHILMPKDYIAYRLTQHIGTEVSDASGTCLFSIEKRCWSKSMIQAMDIPEDWLPPCTESDEIIGTVTADASQQSALALGTPVVAGAGDQPAQALGSGVVRSGLCSVTIGTSGVVFAQGDRHIQHPTGLLHSFCHSVRNQWYLMGVMLSAGGSFQWLRDTFASLAPLSYDKMTALAAQMSPGSEGLIFLPYLTGERVPHDDPRARGAWIGLTKRHGPKHLIRAVMEGITFGLCDSLTLMKELGMPIQTICASGGAAQSELWLHMLADVFQTEIITTNVTEGASYGAAILAAIGIKRYANATEAADALVRVTKTIEPNQRLSAAYSDNYAVYRSLYPKLKDTFAELTELHSSKTSEP